MPTAPDQEHVITPQAVPAAPDQELAEWPLVVSAAPDHVPEAVWEELEEEPQQEEEPQAIPRLRQMPAHLGEWDTAKVARG